MSAGDWKEMYLAAQNGRMELVRYHIENGSNPNYQHPEILATPLVAAISEGHTEIALYLLENGADPTLKSFFDDLTPLQAAYRFKNAVIVEKLKSLGVFEAPSWGPLCLSWIQGLFKN